MKAMLLIRKKTQWQLERPRYLGNGTTISPFYFPGWDALCCTCWGRQGLSWITVSPSFFPPAQEHSRLPREPTLSTAQISCMRKEAALTHTPEKRNLTASSRDSSMAAFASTEKAELALAVWKLPKADSHYTLTALASFTHLKKLPPKSIMTLQQCELW